MIRATEAAEDRTTYYDVDTDMIITSVGGHWAAFADENSPDWDAGAVVGRPLDEFIADDATALLYAELVAKVRRSGRAATFVYRCDAPDVRRHMEMTILPRESGVRFASRIITEEQREPQPLLDPAAARADTVLLVCGWCKKAKTGRQTWSEIEHAVTLLHLGEEDLPLISHGICPECTVQVEDVMSRQLADATELLGRPDPGD